MKKKLKKPSIKTVNHKDGGMSFYAEGGEFDFVRNQSPNPTTNFEKRMYHTPYINNQDGSMSSHKMMSWSDDKGYYAAPTIVQLPDGQLHEFTNPDEAINYAYTTGEYKTFSSPEESEAYANNGYKFGTPMEMFAPNEGFRTFATGGETDPPPFIPPTPEFQKSVQDSIKSQEARKKAEEFAKVEAAKKANSPERFKQKPVLKPTKLASDNARVIDQQIRPEFTPEEMEYFKEKGIPKELYHHTKKQLDTWKAGDIQEAADIVQRRKDVAKQAEIDRNKGLFTQAVAEDISNGYRAFPEDSDSFFDNYLNPFQMVLNPAGNLAGNFAIDAGPVDPRKVALDAGLLALNATGIGEVFNPFVKNLARRSGRYLTTQTPLKNAYKLNPWAFKPNSKAYYRGVGNKGIQDALETGVIKSRDTDLFPAAYFARPNEFKTALYYNPEALIEAKGVDVSRVKSINPNELIFENKDAGAIPLNPEWVDEMYLGNPSIGFKNSSLESIPITNPNIRLLKKDWLKGYKPVQTPSNINGKIGTSIKNTLLDYLDRKISATKQFKKQMGRTVNTDDIKTVRSVTEKQVEKNPLGFLNRISEGADTVNSTLKSRIENLTSEEGYKRLVNQEKEYLKNYYGYGFDKEMDSKIENLIREQAETAAGARINELMRTSNINEDIGNFLKNTVPKIPISSQNKMSGINSYAGGKFGNNIFDKSLYHNAFYRPEPIYNDFLRERIGPGGIGTGLPYLDDVPTIHHEIAHALQRDTRLPIDEELSKITPKLNLNKSEKREFDYFINKESQEPSAFANELRAAMLQRGLIKDIYDDITPNLLQQAYKSFREKPMSLYIKPGKGFKGTFTSNHRIMDFMDPTMENFSTLAKAMNKLPAVLPLGVGLGVGAGLSKQQLGGGIELSNRIYAEGGPFFNDPVSTPGAEMNIIGGLEQKRKKAEADLIKEEQRVKEAREKVIPIAKEAWDNPNYRSEIFKTKLGEDQAYCSTRSCEVERAAGYTVPNDVNVFGRKIPAGSKLPVIPGTNYFDAEAPSLGFEKIPFDEAVPGDRVLQFSPYGGHSMIYAGPEDESIFDPVTGDYVLKKTPEPYFYYDNGSGESFKYNDYPLMKNQKGYRNQAYRYVGNTSNLKKQINKVDKDLGKIKNKKDIYTFEEGGEYELTNQEIQDLRNQGYDIELL